MIEATQEAAIPVGRTVETETVGGFQDMLERMEACGLAPFPKIIAWCQVGDVSSRFGRVWLMFEKQVEDLLVNTRNDDRETPIRISYYRSSASPLRVTLEIKDIRQVVG